MTKNLYKVLMWICIVLCVLSFIWTIKDIIDFEKNLDKVSDIINTDNILGVREYFNLFFPTIVLLFLSIIFGTSAKQIEDIDDTICYINSKSDEIPKRYRDKLDKTEKEISNLKAKINEINLNKE